MEIQMLSQCLSTFGGKHHMIIKDRNDGNIDIVAMFINFWRGNITWLLRTGMMEIQMLSQCLSTFGGKHHMIIKDRNDGNTDVVAMFINFWRETSHDY